MSKITYPKEHPHTTYVKAYRRTVPEAHLAPKGRMSEGPGSRTGTLVPHHI